MNYRLLSALCIITLCTQAQERPHALQPKYAWKKPALIIGSSIAACAIIVAELLMGRTDAQVCEEAQEQLRSELERGRATQEIDEFRTTIWPFNQINQEPTHTRYRISNNGQWRGSTTHTILYRSWLYTNHQLRTSIGRNPQPPARPMAVPRPHAPADPRFPGRARTLDEA